MLNNLNTLYKFKSIHKFVERKSLYFYIVPTDSCIICLQYAYSVTKILVTWFDSDAEQLRKRNILSFRHLFLQTSIPFRYVWCHIVNEIIFKKCYMIDNVPRDLIFVSCVWFIISSPKIIGLRIEYEKCNSFLILYV